MKKTLTRTRLTGAAVGFVLAASGSALAEQSGAEAKEKEISFEAVDQNQDSQVTSNELKDYTDKNMPEANVDFQEYDKNSDSALDQQEFADLKEKLQQKQGAKTTATSGEAQTNEDAQADVTVEGGTPEVNVEAQPPQVTVTQPKPEVEVTQPKPEVNVDQAKPDVKITQQDPKVNVEKSGQADVNIKRPEGATEAGQPGQEQGMQAGIESMTASDLEGKDVRNSQGQKIGTVSKVVQERDTDNLGVVLQAGGFLGVGDSNVFVPLDELEQQQDNIVWTTAKSKEEIKQMEAFNQQRYADLEEKDQPLNKIQADEQQTFPTKGEAGQGKLEKDTQDSDLEEHRRMGNDQQPMEDDQQPLENDQERLENESQSEPVVPEIQ